MRPKTIPCGYYVPQDALKMLIGWLGMFGHDGPIAQKKIIIAEKETNSFEEQTPN